MNLTQAMTAIREDEDSAFNVECGRGYSYAIQGPDMTSDHTMLLLHHAIDNLPLLTASLDNCCFTEQENGKTLVYPHPEEGLQMMILLPTEGWEVI